MVKMGRKFIFIAFIALALSCEKRSDDLDDYLPEVEVVSVEQMPSGALKVSGRVIDKGIGELEVVGFSADTSDSPGLQDNQLQAEPQSDGEFSAVYGSESLGGYRDSLFITAFAGTEELLGTSDPFYVGQVVPGELNNPCDLEVGHVLLGQNSTSYNEIGEIEEFSDGVKRFTAEVGSERRVTFYFAELQSGEYTTDFSTFTLEGMKMNVDVQNFTEVGSLNPGTPVYVTYIGNDTYDITICTGQWSNFFGPYDFETRLEVTVE